MTTFTNICLIFIYILEFLFSIQPLLLKIIHNSSKIGLSLPQQSYKPKLTTTTQPTTIWTTIQSADTIKTIIITFIINSASSSTLILQILQLVQNSVYPTIFTLIHNLITYTTLRTNYLKLKKKNLPVSKSLPKRRNIQSNQRTSIHRNFKVKRNKKIQQQSSQKTEAKKINAIM